MDKHLILLLILFFAVNGYSQDISAFGKKANYGVSGRINLGYNHFSTIGGTERFAPHGYSITGGLHGKIGAIEIPVSFTYSQLSRSISTPFNMFGASPHYKWFKLHLGHRNLSFSPLVFSGRTFFGAGIELNPGKFHFTAFSGRMENLSVVRDSVAAGALVLPSFRRNIQGMRLGIRNKSNRFEVMGVRVVDVSSDMDDRIPVLPQQNFVLGTSVGLRILKNFNFSFNGSASLFTSDRNSFRPENTPEIIARLDPIHAFNFSTRASFAIESSVNYTNKGYMLGMKYRRLDPYYNSLATNFIQNDIENLTLDFGIPIIIRKWTVRGSIGKQKDNLRDHKAFTNLRLIGSLTTNYIPNKNLQVMARYSNFQQESQSGLVEVNDTFRILTITHSIYFNTNWKIIDDDVKGVSMSFNFFNNQVIDEATRNFRLQDNNFSGIGVNGRVNYQYKPWDFSIGPLFNYNLYEFVDFNQGRVGGGIHVNKSFLSQKIHNTMQIIRQQNLFNNKGNGHNTNINLNARFTISKKQNIGIRFMYLNNQSILTTSFNEIRANIVYAYGF